MKRKFNYHIRSMMLLTFFLIIGIMAVSALLLSYQYRTFFTQFHVSYTNLAKVAVLSEQLDRVYYDVTGYADVAGEDRKKIAARYESVRAQWIDAVNQLRPQYTGTAYYHIVDISNMFSTLDDSIVDYFHVCDTTEQPKFYYKPQRLYIGRLVGYIQNELSALSNVVLRSAQSHYENFDVNRRRAEKQMVLSTSIVVLLCLATAFIFSRFISRPIGRLAKRMENFKDPLEWEPHIETAHVSSEVYSLIESYNGMTAQIAGLVGELKEKADVELLLAQQRVDNLEMKNLLQRAELHMLQMQINPHFLFNTLNSINALASIELAEQTSAMIESLAGILRYSLRDLDRFVPLSEEIENVAGYISIQRMRFGQRIRFEMTVDESAKPVPVPSMIIQPLVENAIMHGLDKQHGAIELRIADEDTHVVITVCDDGLGIAPERLQKILQAEPYEHDRGERGIGIDNVMRRLHILYGEDCMRIASEVNVGTTITLRLSKRPPALS